MAFNFQPIDYSQSINYHQNKNNNIQNAVTQMGQAFDTWNEGRNKWDEIMQQKQLEKQKRTAFNNSLKQITDMANADYSNVPDQDALDVENGLNLEKSVQRQPVMQQMADMEDLKNKITNGFDAAGNGKPPTDFDLPMNDYNQDFGNREVDETGIDETLQQNEENSSLVQVSPLAKYKDNPMFLMAVAESQRTESMQPLINFMTVMSQEDKDLRDWNHQIEREQKADDFQRQSLDIQRANEAVEKAKDAEDNAKTGKSNKYNQLAARYNMGTLDRSEYGKLKNNKAELRKRKAELEEAYNWAVDNNDEKLMQNVLQVLHQYNNMIYPAPTFDPFG